MRRLSCSDLITCYSDVTRVSNTRGGNWWGCHLSIFSWKTWRPFLVITVSARTSSAVSCVTPVIYFLLKNWRPFFAHHCHFLLISLGCHPPWRVSPRTFFYLSDIVSPLFCVNLTIFFLRVLPTWRVSPGAVRPLVTGHWLVSFAICFQMCLFMSAYMFELFSR